MAVESPSHTWLEPDITAIVLVGATEEFTFIVIPELVVTVQVTMSEFASDEEVNEELLVPTSLPLTCH